MATTKTENEEIARQLIEEVWLEGNLDLIDELLANDFVVHSNAAPEPVHGPAEYKEFVSSFRTGVSDLDVTVEDVIADEDKVVFRNRGTGTHDGEFMGIEPTEKEFEMQQIVIVRIEGGQIAEIWGQNDMLGALQQLGVELPGE